MEYLVFAGVVIPVSLMPGFNMLLAWTLGVALGYRATLWAIGGQLAGLFIVAISTAALVSKVAQYEGFFRVLSWAGAAVLLYMAYNMVRSKSRFEGQKMPKKRAFALMMQGFLTAVSNPKAWLFFIALFPKFVALKEVYLVGIIVGVEFVSLSLYALGGSAFKRVFSQYGGVINYISAACIAILAVAMVI